MLLLYEKRTALGYIVKRRQGCFVLAYEWYPMEKGVRVAFHTDIHQAVYIKARTSTFFVALYNKVDFNCE